MVTPVEAGLICADGIIVRFRIYGCVITRTVDALHGLIFKTPGDAVAPPTAD